LKLKFKPFGLISLLLMAAVLIVIAAKSLTQAVIATQIYDINMGDVLERTIRKF